MTHDQPFRLPLHCPLIIDGEEAKASSGRQFARENPADVREVATIAEEGTLEDARAAIEAAWRAFDGNAGNWIYNYKLREQALQRTAQAIRANADRLARVVSLEVGMPMRQAVPHVAAAADIFDFYAGLAGKLYGESFTLPSGSTINLVREPVGVVGMITPWNFPLTQTARKVAPALAAGCTVVCKPATQTPLLTLDLHAVFDHLPAGVVNIVTGSGREVGDALVRHPDVPCIAFTGSTSTGQHIYRLAADRVKKLHLELGGSDAVIVCADTDLDAAARAVSWAAFLNAGQICTSAERVYVEQDVLERFTDRFAGLAGRLVIGPGIEERTEVTPLIGRRERHLPPAGDARSRLDHGELERARAGVDRARRCLARLERARTQRHLASRDRCERAVRACSFRSHERSAATLLRRIL